MLIPEIRIGGGMSSCNLIKQRQRWKAFSVLIAAELESPSLDCVLNQETKRITSKNEHEIMSVWLKIESHLEAMHSWEPDAVFPCLGGTLKIHTVGSSPRLPVPDHTCHHWRPEL